MRAIYTCEIDMLVSLHHSFCVNLMAGTMKRESGREGMQQGGGVLPAHKRESVLQ